MQGGQARDLPRCRRGYICAPAGEASAGLQPGGSQLLLSEGPPRWNLQLTLLLLTRPRAPRPKTLKTVLALARPKWIPRFASPSGSSAARTSALSTRPCPGCRSYSLCSCREASAGLQLGRSSPRLLLSPARFPVLQKLSRRGIGWPSTGDLNCYYLCHGRSGQPSSGERCSACCSREAARLSPLFLLRTIPEPVRRSRSCRIPR